MGDFYISADLGQVNDYTAITIIERITKHAGNEYHLRHIERPERGTTYPKIAERIHELFNSPELAQHNKYVVIDITGVGRPVWDIMKNSGYSHGFCHRLSGISITGGSNVTKDGAIYNVPKRDLVSALQVVFQNKELKIAKGIPNADVLISEMTNFRVKINTNGHDQYEAWREGVHDDIVLSAAMGVWLASRPVNRIITSNLRFL